MVRVIGVVNVRTNSVKHQFHPVADMRLFEMLVGGVRIHIFLHLTIVIKGGSVVHSGAAALDA